MRARLRQFFAHEAAAGIVMLCAAALAICLANSFVSSYYTAALAMPVIGHFTLAHIVSDVLMPIFFLKVGLELKEEMHGGALATTAQRVLPLIAALGGVVLPALIYLAVTAGDDALRAGWAIPTATDIAFAICVLNLVGKRVPPAAKIFLLAIAIYDDIAAILIIAFFYSDGLQWLPALQALVVAGVMMFCQSRPHSTRLVLVLGVLLAYLLHDAGIHTTVAGLITGLCIPRRAMTELIAKIDPWVAFGILPVFALASAGVSLGDVGIATLHEPLPLGIILGLFLGKQLGIFSATFIAVKTGIAKRPQGASWSALYGIAAVAGIGFTMSLFIGDLAFTDRLLHNELKIGVLAGSLLSALAGVLLLRASARP